MLFNLVMEDAGAIDTPRESPVRAYRAVVPPRLNTWITIRPTSLTVRVAWVVKVHLQELNVWRQVYTETAYLLPYTLDKLRSMENSVVKKLFIDIVIACAASPTIATLPCIASYIPTLGTRSSSLMTCTAVSAGISITHSRKGSAQPSAILFISASLSLLSGDTSNGSSRPKKPFQ